MELIGRIVPAIRETRVPLISGYAWLLAGWLAVTTFTDIETTLNGPQEPVSLGWALARAFDPLEGFGAGVALTVTAFILGSLIGFLWDLVLRPVDERALRERATRHYTEAQLRLQLAAPALTAVIALAGRSVWYLIGLLVPTLLVSHGWALWLQARQQPMRADLRNADLSSAYLGRANFAHADLTGANLLGADLNHADLHEVAAGLTVEQLRQARDLTGVRLSRVRIPGDLGRVRLQKADLSDSNLTKADLSYANLAGADLTGANLIKADLNKADLTGANLIRALLNEADLTEAKLTGANLAGANLIGATLVGTDFSGADLRSVVLSGAELLAADLAGANLSGAYLTGADLVEANLHKADLSGAELGGARLIEAELAGANLAGAFLAGADLTDADLSGTTSNADTTWPEGFNPPTTLTRPGQRISKLRHRRSRRRDR